MSIDATLAVLYAQTGMATSMANAASVAPMASAAMSRMLASEMARQEQQHITKSEKGSKMSLSADAKHHNSPHFGSRRRRRTPATPEEDVEHAANSTLGNLLNMKI
ncbi:MAG: hypothetical protein J5861_04005 [Desulfovibrio sp.]|nr:hypothetical protein [Desulfovibrio sp.]